MSSPAPPPDHFNQEIDNVVRLAEKRLQRESAGFRIKQATRRAGSTFDGFHLRLPAVETMAGWALALLLLSWLVSLVRISAFLSFWMQVAGIALLAAAIIISVTRGQSGSSGPKEWRGRRIDYGSNAGPGLLDRFRRLFRNR